MKLFLNWIVFFLSTSLAIFEGFWLIRTFVEPEQVQIHEGKLVAIECGLARVRTIGMTINSACKGRVELFFVGYHCDVLNGAEEDDGKDVVAMVRGRKLISLSIEGKTKFREKNPNFGAVLLLILGLTSAVLVAYKGKLLANIWGHP